MYHREEISILELFQQKLTQEKSIKALRGRVKDGILVFIREDGRRQLFDKQLSVIRAIAARRLKRPGVTWGMLGRFFKELDNDNPPLNEKIISWLNDGLSQDEVIEKTKELIKAKLEG